MTQTKQRDRLKEIFESTVESGIKYDGSHERIEYYNMFCKAAAQEKLYKMMGNNLCMFNCIYENSDAVMMIFYIPINSNDSGAKNVAERVMEVVEGTEACFITLDYIKSEEVKEDKFIYVTAIKKINQEEE
jgi:hypothetical protein